MRKEIEQHITIFMRKIEEMTSQITSLVNQGLFHEVEPIFVKRMSTLEELFKAAPHDKEAMAMYARLMYERNLTLKQQIEVERELIRKGLANIEHVKRYTE